VDAQSGELDRMDAELEAAAAATGAAEDGHERALAQVSIS
jgi:hypothetical protein